MTGRGRWRGGLALVALYAAVTAVTHGLAPGPVRPVFDGFAPPAPYRWVRPPPEFASGNVAPQPVQRAVPLGPQGSEATNASTPDAQIILTLPAGAVPAHPPDGTVSLTITPIDPGTLAPLPAPLRPVANAYRVELVYQPSQGPVAGVTGNATIALTAASTGEALLYSPDGRQWQTAASRPFGNTHGVTGPFSGPGYYLVAAPPGASTTTARGTGGGRGGTVVLVLVAVVALGVVVAAVIVRRGRTQGTQKRRGRGRKRGRSVSPRRRP